MLFISSSPLLPRSQPCSHLPNPHLYSSPHFTSQRLFSPLPGCSGAGRGSTGSLEEHPACGTEHCNLPTPRGPSFGAGPSCWQSSLIKEAADILKVGKQHVLRNSFLATNRSAYWLSSVFFHTHRVSTNVINFVLGDQKSWLWKFAFGNLECMRRFSQSLWQMGRCCHRYLAGRRKDSFIGACRDGHKVSNPASTCMCYTQLHSSRFQNSLFHTSVCVS